MSRERNGVATYLYCVVQREVAPSLAKVPPGLSGMGRPRVLAPGGRLWVIAADASVSLYGAEPIARGLRDLPWVSARAVAHEAVIEFFAKAGPTIPFRLFTLFTSDARALAHISKRRTEIARVFRRIAGRQEWGLRIRFDPERALPRPPAGAQHKTVLRGSGTRFLLRRKKAQDTVQQRSRRARAEANRIFQDLTRQADDARRRTPSEGEGRTPIVLEAAFLLKPKQARRFCQVVRRVAARLAQEGCDVTLTGPWPPYNFVGRPA